MKQNIIKILIFIMTFVLSLLVFSLVMNKGNTDMTVEMDPPSLPVVNMVVEGHKVNTLFGYLSEMDQRYLRDTLTPMGEDKKLSLSIQDMGSEIHGIGYELRSTDCKRLVEKTDLYNFISKDDGEVTVDFSLKDLIEKDTEYMLVLILSTADEPEIRYYTRVIENDEFFPDERISFVEDFHNRTFDRDAASEIVTYLESNEEGDNSTYAHVDIHSSFYQVTWGSLNIGKVNYLSTDIYEMDEALADIGMSYEVEIKPESPEKEEPERYLVKEYYRTRYTPERTYLLEYERDMEQIFDPNKEVFVNDKVVLGITPSDIKLKENNEGTAVVFTQADALYEYRNNDGILSKVFSFYDEDSFDIRTLNDDHRIKTLSVDETGNLFFAVYGYMNRGRHEGEVGASIYYYDSARNYIEEKIFVPYKGLPGMLMEDVEKLSYVTKNNDLYIYVGRSIYCVDLDSGDSRVVVEDTGSDGLLSSQSNQVVAWQEDGLIHLVDVGSSKTRIIDHGSGSEITPIGFMGDDIVYGIADPLDRADGGSGGALMHTIKIEDKKGNELKTYHEDGVYVSKAQIGNMTLHIKRVKKIPQTGGYVSIADDQIMDNKEEKKTKNKIVQVVTENREKVTQIALTGNVNASIKVQIPDEMLMEGGQTLLMNENDTVGEYYVFGNGEYVGSLGSANEAVKTAAGVNGVVLDENMGYIWQKGKRKIRTEISGPEFDEDAEGVSTLALCLDVMSDHAGVAIGPGPVQAMLDEGKDISWILENENEHRALDLSECDLPSVLYYVSNDIPVLAFVPGNSQVILVGYDEKNVIIMDPVTKTRYRKGMNDASHWFEDGGQRFMALLP